MALSSRMSSFRTFISRETSWSETIDRGGKAVFGGDMELEFSG